MKRLSFGITVLVVLVGFGSACYFEIPGYPPSGVYYSPSGFRRAVDFPSGGTLSLRSFDGYIEISGWEAERVELFAEKKNPALEIEFDKSGETLEISARCPDKEGKGCVTEFYLDVPQDINLRDIIGRDGDVLIRDLYGNVAIQVRKGSVQVDNFSGSLVATVSEGTIEARILDLREKDEVKLLTEKGDIILYLESDLTGEIKGFAPKGQISSEFGSDDPESEQEFAVKLGEGGTRLSLTALDGDIRIRVIKEDSHGRI
ncbi:MAG: hypothetical protein GQ544_07415 [Candidatus Aminicenantes bacterium]|nr:hypothetical protein [Candidatus Aminicenantes bacterium]